MTKRFMPGDHIQVNRSFYKHHGIYVGNNQVVHFSGDKKTKGTSAYIRLDSFETFSSGDFVEFVQRAKTTFEQNEVVQKALSMLGKKQGDYHFIFDNCEHFCRELLNGVRQSLQVQKGTNILFIIAGVLVLMALSRR